MVGVDCLLDAFIGGIAVTPLGACPLPARNGTARYEVEWPSYLLCINRFRLPAPFRLVARQPRGLAGRARSAVKRALAAARGSRALVPSSPVGVVAVSLAGRSQLPALRVRDESRYPRCASP